MKTRDRFDLEQSILQCWNIVDELEMLIETDNLNEKTIDALTTIYRLKFDRCFQDFEDCIHIRQL